jgi:hypothetical protein
LISGHEHKKSPEVYHHLSLENVEHAYQEAVKALEVYSLPFTLPLVTASLYLGLLTGGVE